uniref:Uncharacterized protein n=1 Tax=Aegilops tauschii TaxID=37682 RepID=M8C340_AEGTA
MESRDEEAGEACGGATRTEENSATGKRSSSDSACLGGVELLGRWKGTVDLREEQVSPALVRARDTSDAASQGSSTIVNHGGYGGCMTLEQQTMSAKHSLEI